MEKAIDIAKSPSRRELPRQFGKVDDANGSVRITKGDNKKCSC